jgi:hypothetical protein
MLAKSKPCLILKEHALKRLPTDIVGHLYTEFHRDHLASDIEAALTRWLAALGHVPVMEEIAGKTATEQKKVRTRRIVSALRTAREPSTIVRQAGCFSSLAISDRETLLESDSNDGLKRLLLDERAATIEVSHAPREWNPLRCARAAWASAARYRSAGSGPPEGQRLRTNISGAEREGAGAGGWRRQAGQRARRMRNSVGLGSDNIWWIDYTARRDGVLPPLPRLFSNGHLFPWLAPWAVSDAPGGASLLCALEGFFVRCGNHGDTIQAPADCRRGGPMARATRGGEATPMMALREEGGLSAISFRGRHGLISWRPWLGLA